MVICVHVPSYVHRHDNNEQANDFIATMTSDVESACNKELYSVEVLICFHAGIVLIVLG